MSTAEESLDENDEDTLEEQLLLDIQQNIYNTLTELFLQRGYLDIENQSHTLNVDGKMNVTLLVGDHYVFNNVMIQKICDLCDGNLETVKRIVFEIKKKIRECSFTDKPYNIDLFKYIVRDKVNRSEYEKYREILKKVLRNSKRPVAAFYTICPKITVKQLEFYVRQMEALKIKNAILVYEKTTAHINPILSDLRDHDKHIEIFEASSLIRNITKHRLYQKHEELFDEEKAEISEKGIDASKLSVISSNDAVCKFFGFRKSSVIRIHRKCGTFANGEPMIMLAYRVVK